MTHLLVSARSTGGGALGASRLAAAGYLPCFLLATLLAVRRGHKAEPLGLHTPFPVAVDALAGVGTGLSAPWPLIVSLWFVRRGACGGDAGRRKTAGLALLGAAFLAGAVSEPVTHRLFAGRLRRDEAVVVGLNLLLPVVVLGGAVASLAAATATR